MKVVTLLRKPLAKGATIASNSRACGTGGINVDGCRVGSSDVGRFPANLIVQHLPNCTVKGTIKSSYTINQWTEGAQPFGKAAGKPYEGSTHEGSCDVWSCAEECIVGTLNASADVGGNESEREAGVARFFKQVRE